MYKVRAPYWLEDYVLCRKQKALVTGCLIFRTKEREKRVA